MNNTVPTSDCGHAPGRTRRGWLDLPLLLLVIAAAFVAGNHAPPIRTWLAGFEDAHQVQEAVGKEPPGKPAELAAKWTQLRDQAEQNLEVAESILKVMRAQKLPDAEINAQRKKVDALKEEQKRCDQRLQELAEHAPPAGHATDSRKEQVNAEELDIQHRRWLDQERLQKIVPGAKPTTQER